MTKPPAKLPSPEDRYRGERLREIRASKDLTQPQLGAMIGTTQQTISRLEKGLLWDFEWARRVADALRVSPSEFFPHQPLTEAERELLQLARDMSDSSLETWKAIGQTLKERQAPPPFRAAS